MTVIGYIAIMTKVAINMLVTTWGKNMLSKMGINNYIQHEVNMYYD